MLGKYFESRIECIKLTKMLEALVWSPFLSTAKTKDKQTYNSHFFCVLLDLKGNKERGLNFEKRQKSLINISGPLSNIFPFIFVILFFKKLK